MCRAARLRAQAKRLPFELSLEDIHIPEMCPVLGIPLRRSPGRAAPNSPSLDRIIPSLGYVPGNVVVISNRANILKRDATVEELQLLARFYTKLLKGKRT